MAIVGFVFILISALNYIFGRELGDLAAPVGIIFVGVGMVTIKISSK